MLNLPELFDGVDDAGLEEFLTSYPHGLIRDVFRACEPALITFNDFRRAPKWPDSVVAYKTDGVPGGKVLRALEARSGADQ